MPAPRVAWAVSIAVVTLVAGVGAFALVPRILGPQSPTSCPYGLTSPAPPQFLNANNPYVLPPCSSYDLSTVGTVTFGLTSSVDISGSWTSNVPVRLSVLNASDASSPSYGWTDAGPFKTQGTLSTSLFPGKYSLTFTLPPGSSAQIILATTTGIVASFDRHTTVLQGPATFAVSPDGFTGWPLGSSNENMTYVSTSMATNACNYTIAVLTPSALQLFREHNTTLGGAGIVIIGGAVDNPCPASIPMTSIPSSLGGPYNFTSGDTLIFFNAGPANATLAISGYLQVSYLAL
jgi:hypothetical protein